MEERQSTRMERELASMRLMFKEAEADQEVSQAVAISRIILQQEKEIAKQKIAEGRTLEAAAIHEYQTKLVNVITDVSKVFVDEDRYPEFIDAIIAAVAELEMSNG